MNADVVKLVEAATEDLPDQAPDGLSHDALALALGRQWEDEARHVAAWGRWFFWDGHRWRRDDTLAHITRAREFLRDLAGRLDDPKVAKQIRSKEMVARVVSLARSNPLQAATTGQWDAEDWLLATPGGLPARHPPPTEPPRTEPTMPDEPKKQTIDWTIPAPETGGKPEEDPRKASFRWRDGESVIKTQDFTREDLEAQIRRLEERGEEVPPEYREALESFERG